MVYLIAFVLVFLVGLGPARRARASTWLLQIALGDAIAIKKGTYVKRLIRKRMHKTAGKTINKIKGK